MSTVVKRPAPGKVRQRPLPDFDQDRPIWTKQDNESKTNHELFTEYLHMGEGRSLSQVAEKTGRSVSRLTNLSSQFAWPHRVEAYVTKTRSDEMLRINDDRRRGEQEALDRVRANANKLNDSLMNELLALPALERAKLLEKLDGRLLTRVGSSNLQGRSDVNVAVQVNNYDRETALTEMKNLLDYVGLTPDQQNRFADRARTIIGQLG